MLLCAAATRSPSRAGFVVVLLSIILLPQAAPAQAQLEGRLRDLDSGAALIGALLQLESTDGPSRRQYTHSDTTGAFRFASVPPGTWLLRVELVGYSPLQQPLQLDGPAPFLDLDLAPQPLLIDEVVVRARRPGEAQHSAAFVETITLDAQGAPGASMAQLLDRATGVDVRRSGGLGSFSTVSIRGSTAEQVQVFLDGVPLNRALGGGVDLGELPLGGVESVQIYRGAVPARFGGNSLGGVVHIRSRKLPDRTQFRLGAGSGSFATRQFSASIGGPWKAWEYLALLDHNRSANDFRFWDDNGTEYNADDDGWNRRRNSDFKALRSLLKIGRPWGAARLQLHHTFDLSHKGVPGIGTNQSLQTRFDRWRSLSEANLFGTLAGAGYRLRAYHALERQVYKDLQGEVGIGIQHDRNTTRSAGLRGELNALLPGGILSTSFAAARHERFTPNSLVRDTRTHSSRRRGLSLGTELEVPLGPRLQLNLGAQGEGMDDRFFDQAALPFNALTPSRDKRQALWGFRLGGQIDLGRGWALRGHRGRYQRAPNFFELFGDKGAVIGNTDLRREDGTHWDAGLVFRGRPKVDTGLALIEVVYYANRVDDLIRFEHNSQQVSRPHNFGRAHLQGVESRLQARLFALFQLSGNYAYQRAENRTPFAFERGRDLPNAPRHRLSARLALVRPGAGLHYEFSRDSRHFLDRANLRPVVARTVHNLGGSKGLGHGAALSGEIRNLSNNQVADLWGYPLPGRAYFLSLHYQFNHAVP